MPWNLSGSGRRLLVRRRNRSTFTVSSPVLVLNSVPSAPTMSPRSRCLKSAYASAPIASTLTRNWIRPVASCTVAKLALPMTRLSISRPAIETAMACGSSASLSRWPCLRISSAARSFGLKSFGNATPRARIAASLSRRSAMRALSSVGDGGVVVMAPGILWTPQRVAGASHGIETESCQRLARDADASAFTSSADRYSGTRFRSCRSIAG